MAISQNVIDDIRERYERIRPHLDERRRRLWAGNEALQLGRGGRSAVSRATGMSVNTVKRGMQEAQQPVEESLDPSRVRAKGGGRKPLTELDPGLLPALDALIEPQTRGDPMSPLRWTSKSTEKLAAALTAQDHPVSADVVGRLLKDKGYSLQSTRKRFEGSKHPDRNAQFEYLADKAQAQLDRGWPVISVDTKKKELVGQFGRGGQEWQPKGQPVEVEAYDFTSLAEGVAVPYGVYDVKNNEGWVSVGMSADTAEFSVHSIHRWWQEMGSSRYADAEEVVITADCGGSNGYRLRLWKLKLQQLANTLNKRLTVLHYPPGTSKWNRIEHRMFNHITFNWRGRPLESYACIVESIAATTTTGGLRIRAEQDTNTYNKGIKVSDQQMADININPHDFHGEWNYTISPQSDQLVER